MYISFLIQDWADIQPEKSSTLLIIQECFMRGHQVSVIYPKNLTVRNNIVHGFIKIFNPMTTKIPENPVSFYKKVTFEEKLVPLHACDCIFIRKDPPIDAIVLNFLDSVKNETVIVNDVDGLRKANNKLYTATFHDPTNTFLPVTHVSKNKEYLKRIINESPSEKMIMKPLDGSGGRGVIIIEKAAKTNITSLLDFYIDRNEKNYVIVQEYVEGADKGDVRVLMLNGKAIGAYKRVPAEGEIRANIQVGGKAQKYDMTETQLQLCRKIGPKLVEDGLFFVGLDLVDNKLLEVNVLNPGGISNINRLNKVKLQKQVVDFLEEKVNEKQEKRAEMEYLLKRMQDLRMKEK